MTISRRALEALEDHAWPGNVRELENLMERMVALTEGDVIQFEDLPAEMCAQGGAKGDISLELTERGMDMVAAIAEIERGLISRPWAFGWSQGTGRHLLGINRTTLVEKIKRMGMAKRIMGGPACFGLFYAEYSPERGGLDALLCHDLDLSGNIPFTSLYYPCNCLDRSPAHRS